MMNFDHPGLCCDTPACPQNSRKASGEHLPSSEQDTQKGSQGHARSLHRASSAHIWGQGCWSQLSTQVKVWGRWEREEASKETI